MPSYRIGVGSDFVLKNRGVGIGSDNPKTGLDVAGTTKSKYLDVSGVSTLTSYSGFYSLEQGGDTTFSADHTAMGDIVVGVGETFIVSSGSTVSVRTFGTISIGTHFSPPIGDMNDRQEVPVEGTVRFNRDLNTLEFYNGVEWRQFIVSGNTGRGVFMGGEAPNILKHISYANISSLGNSINFGDLSLGGKYGAAGMSNTTRGVIAGGWSGVDGNQFDIEYITIASEGKAIDWGANNTGGWGSQGTSSSTRGISAGGGYPTASVTIESIFFSTVGSKEDWGDITALRGRGTTGCNNPTRSVFFGGYISAHSSLIEYKTTASDGDTVFFGDLINLNRLNPGMSSSTRGVMGGSDYNVLKSSLGYITIASTGNAEYFGDLSVIRNWGGATSNQVRGLYVGGRRDSTYINTIDYCTISSAGNFMDFGDLTGGNTMEKACVSDSHGGLGGF